MEQHKQSYLIYFLKRTPVSLEDFVNVLKENEPRLRNSYEETIEICSDKFLEIIICVDIYIHTYLHTYIYTYVYIYMLYIYTQVSIF